jgi:uncharacterized protein YoxC
MAELMTADNAFLLVQFLGFLVLCCIFVFILRSLEAVRKALDSIKSVAGLEKAVHDEAYDLTDQLIQMKLLLEDMIRQQTRLNENLEKAMQAKEPSLRVIKKEKA